MAAGLHPLRLLQFGKEAVAGTALAATFKAIGAAAYTPEIDRTREEFPRGVRVPYAQGGYNVRKGSLVQLETHLTYEELMWPLMSGLVTGTVSGVGDDKVWAFDPDVTGQFAGESLTGEFVVDDASNDHYEREFTYGTTRRFAIGLAANELATLSWELFGRAEVTSTKTASLTEMTGREVVPSNLFKVYIDDAWANLGNTQKSGLIRSATLEIVTGLEPNYTTDGRSDLDFTGLRNGMLDATLSLLMEHTADAATEIGKWRTGGAASQRFVRLEATSPVVLGGTFRKLFFDLSMSYLSPPVFSEADGIELVSMELGLDYDTTGSEAIEATLTNSLATFT